MRVSVLGLGYVGCVTSACLARAGHQVVGVDANREKVELVAAGRSPIVEPGPSGRRHDAPGVHTHHWLRWRRSTGPVVGWNTRDPGTRFSAGAPGKSAGSSGRTATVT